MNNTVNSFQDLDKLFGTMLNDMADTVLGDSHYHDEEEYQPRRQVAKKPSRYQRMKTQINFNIRKFTNHRYVGNGIRAVSKRKFNINPEVN